MTAAQLRSLFRRNLDAATIAASERNDRIARAALAMLRARRVL